MSGAFAQSFNVDARALDVAGATAGMADDGSYVVRLPKRQLQRPAQLQRGAPRDRSAETQGDHLSGFQGPAVARDGSTGLPPQDPALQRPAAREPRAGVAPTAPTASARQSLVLTDPVFDVEEEADEDEAAWDSPDGVSGYTNARGDWIAY